MRNNKKNKKIIKRLTVEVDITIHYKMNYK